MKKRCQDRNTHRQMTPEESKERKLNFGGIKDGLGFCKNYQKYHEKERIREGATENWNTMPKLKAKFKRRAGRQELKFHKKSKNENGSFRKKAQKKAGERSIQKGYKNIPKLQDSSIRRQVHLMYHHDASERRGWTEDHQTSPRQNESSEKKGGSRWKRTSQKAAQGAAQPCGDVPGSTLSSWGWHPAKRACA